MSKTTLISVIFALAFLGLIVYSTLQLSQVSCKVCVTYNGQTNCATASGTTAEEARRTAQDVACATISSGVTETIGCSNTPPDSVDFQ